MRRVTKIPFSLPHNGGAYSAPARERRGAMGPRKRPSRGVGRSPTYSGGGCMIQVDRKHIERVAALIRPYIRLTAIVETSGSDFGFAPCRLTFKLELLQHASSFKTRGAFTNLLLRKVPDAVVVAASGGNHGAAVAYAAQRLGVRAKIYVPTVSSPAKIARIRGYGAELA